MRKLFILSIAMMFGLFAVAQKIGQVPADLQKQAAQRTHVGVDMPLNLTTSVNPYVAPGDKSTINEEIIGNTLYDLQTNQAVQNRIYLHGDGNIGATFTFGLASPNFTDRGTGYNYFNGTAWGAQPTARIEAVRNGWPSYGPLGTDGEFVITHNGSTGLLVYTRTPKGTGTWNLTSTLVGPTTTGSTTALLWPRAISDGNTIHVIATTDQAVSPAVYYYEGLALALVYYKSTDGGATWSAPAILPGMDSASVVTTVNKGFGGDSYAWAAPMGDTIAFVVGDSWSDLFVMKSFDGGTTWDKITVYEFPDITVAPTPIITSTDGSAACALDSDGDVHVVFGRMRVSDDVFTDDQSSYYPYTDGLIYWNESMTMLDSLTLNDDASLRVIGGMLDYDQSGVIEFPTVGTGEFPFGNYFLSLSSMPQMIFDDNGDLYVTYSACRENKTNAGANPNEQLYRDLYATRSLDNGATWDSIINLVDNPTHMFDECVFASLSYTSDANLHIVFQADEEPGLAVRGDLDPYATNYIYYMQASKDPWTIGVAENNAMTTEVSIYPNPANAYTTVAMNLSAAQDISITVYNLIGESVFAKNYGSLNAGQHNLNLNTSSFNSGIYFISINSGDSKITRKLIVE